MSSATPNNILSDPSASEAVRGGVDIGVAANRLVWSLTRWRLGWRYMRQPQKAEWSVDPANSLLTEARQCRRELVAAIERCFNSNHGTATRLFDPLLDTLNETQSSVEFYRDSEPEEESSEEYQNRLPDSYSPWYPEVGQAYIAKIVKSPVEVSWYEVDQCIRSVFQDPAIAARPYSIEVDKGILLGIAIDQIAHPTNSPRAFVDLVWSTRSEDGRPILKHLLKSDPNRMTTLRGEREERATVIGHAARSESSELATLRQHMLANASEQCAQIERDRVSERPPSEFVERHAVLLEPEGRVPSDCQNQSLAAALEQIRSLGIIIDVSDDVANGPPRQLAKYLKQSLAFRLDEATYVSNTLRIKYANGGRKAAFYLGESRFFKDVEINERGQDLAGCSVRFELMKRLEGKSLADLLRTPVDVSDLVDSRRRSRLENKIKEAIQHLNLRLAGEWSTGYRISTAGCCIRFLRR